MVVEPSFQNASKEESVHTFLLSEEILFHNKIKSPLKQSVTFERGHDIILSHGHVF